LKCLSSLLLSYLSTIFASKIINKDIDEKSENIA